MRRDELAGALPLLAPFAEVLAVGVAADDAGVVAVGDVDVAGGGDGHVGRHVEVGLVHGELALRADGQQQLALGGVLLDDVIADVGNPDVALGIDLDVMGHLDVLAPEAQELALGVVDLNRVQAHMEHRRCLWHRRQSRGRGPTACRPAAAASSGSTT